MTTAIVLAAGVGKRLAGATALPKWLVPVSTTCPATEQLEGLAVSEITDVRVVVGDQTAEIRSVVEGWRDKLDVRLIINEHSTTLNNWYSLLLGLRDVLPGGPDDILVLNSDLFADHRWFVESIAAIRSNRCPAALGVDPTKGGTDEAMKVALDSATSAVAGIGKTGIENPGGEYVGLAWWKHGSAIELAAALDSFSDRPEAADNWYEHAIQSHIEAGETYAASFVASPAWVEIDDPTDLAVARQLLSDGP